MSKQTQLYYRLLILIVSLLPFLGLLLSGDVYSPGKPMKFWLGKGCDDEDIWYETTGDRSADSIELVSIVNGIYPLTSAQMHDSIIMDWCRYEPRDAFWANQIKYMRLKQYIQEHRLHEKSNAELVSHFYSAPGIVWKWYILIGVGIIVILLSQLIFSILRRKELQDSRQVQLEGLDFWLFMIQILTSCLVVFYAIAPELNLLGVPVWLAMSAASIFVMGHAATKVNDYFK